MYISLHGDKDIFQIEIKLASNMGYTMLNVLCLIGFRPVFFVLFVFVLKLMFPMFEWDTLLCLYTKTEYMLTTI
jgi:hypothetical protein